MNDDERASRLNIEQHHNVLARLYDAAVVNEEAIKEQLAKLENVINDVEKLSELLPVFVAEKTTSALQEAFGSANRRLVSGLRSLESSLKTEVDAAGEQIISKFDAANRSAEIATAAYERAVQQVFWRMALFPALGVVCAAVVMLAIALWLLPNRSTLAALQAEEARLEANIAELRRRGGDAEVITCTIPGGTTRLCVRTDETIIRDVFRRNGPETFRLLAR